MIICAYVSDHFSQNIIREINLRGMIWTGCGVHKHGKSKANRIQVKKSEGKALLGRSWPRWGYNIKMDLEEREWENVAGQGQVADSGEDSNSVTCFIKLVAYLHWEEEL